MDAQTIEARYLAINKFFGQLIGTWPDQNKVIKFVLRIVTLTIIMSALITVVARTVVFYTFKSMTDQLPFIILGFGIFVKQCNYIINESKLRNLLNGMVSDWLVERPREELEILETYGGRAVLFSYIYRANICFCAFMFCLVPCVPPVLDILVPLNESRALLFIYPAYYFVDEEKYYFYIIAHMIIGAMILTFVFVGCDVNLMCTVLHACALLEISGQRFKHAMDNCYIVNEKQPYPPVVIYYKKVCRSIHAHQRAIEYIENIESCHVVYLFLMLGVVIVNFTVTFVKASYCTRARSVTQVLPMGDQVATFELTATYFTFCTFIVSQLIHLLFLTLMGQFVINSNDETFHNIYESLWYKDSSKIQYLYVLVLRKCLTPPKLTCGGLVELNLSSFLQILKASFSYYTVLSTA